MLFLSPLSTGQLSALSWDFQSWMNTQLVELMSSCNSSFQRVCDVSFRNWLAIEESVIFSLIYHRQV